MGYQQDDWDEPNENENEVWRIVWNLGGPPKLSHFVWQACKGSMVVKKELHRRHIASDDICASCGTEVESIAMEVWAHSEFNQMVKDAPSSTFTTRLVWLAGKIDREQLRRLLALAWAVWFCRNKQVRENTSLNVVCTAASFSKLVADYVLYARKVFSTQLPPSVLSTSAWCRPPKFNVDAHIVAGAYCGLGVIARGENGSLLLAATNWLEAAWDVEASEAVAVRYGMSLARRFGYKKICMECDSINVARKIDENSKGSSPLWLIYNDIGSLIHEFDAFVISHVKRVSNTGAHLVARWDTQGSSELICMNSFPQSLTTLAEFDLQ